jgi:hypothetical protein
MRARTAVLILTFAILVPSLSFGRGGTRSSSHSSGSSGKSVHVHSYTKMDGTHVQEHDRSAPGSGGGTARAKRSSHASSKAGTELGQTLTPESSVVSHSKTLSSGTIASRPTTTASQNSANARPSTATTNSNLGAQTPTVGFVGGYPFVYGLPWSSGMDPESAARRQFGPLVSNASNLIRAGVYAPAVELLRRVITGAPGTRIAARAQRLLAGIPLP